MELTVQVWQLNGMSGHFGGICTNLHYRISPFSQCRFSLQNCSFPSHEHLNYFDSLYLNSGNALKVTDDCSSNGTVQKSSLKLLVVEGLKQIIE